MFYREGVIDKLIKNVKNREKAMIGKILIKDPFQSSSLHLNRQ